MSGIFQNIIDDIKNVESNIDIVILELVKKYEKDIINFNLNDQLREGINAEGENIQPYYAASTIRRKRKKSQPFDRVTLRDEGDFYDSFFIAYRDDEFEINASDIKKIWLEKRYGKSVFGLTELNISKLQEMIKDELIERLQKRIGND